MAKKSKQIAELAKVDEEQIAETEKVELAQIPYDEAVTEAKQIIAAIESSEMRLGELADRLEPKYGEQTLTRFAKEIGIAVCTLERRRSVYRAYKEIPAPAPKSFAVAQELAAHPDRAEIITNNPNLKKSEARKLMKAWRQKDQQEKTSDDWQLEDTRRWFKDLVTRANDAIADGELSETHHLDPAKRQILREVVEPTLVPILREGGAAWIKLADFLKRCLMDETKAAA